MSAEDWIIAYELIDCEDAEEGEPCEDKDDEEEDLPACLKGQKALPRGSSTTTAQDSILYETAEKLGISLAQAKILLFMSLSSFESIRRISKTELMRLKAIKSDNLVYVMKAISRSTIDSIKKEILIEESQIETLKSSIKTDAVNIFSPSVNNLLESSTVQKSVTDVEMYKIVSRVVEDSFSKMFKRVDD